jgi:hypothetical protein
MPALDRKFKPFTLLALAGLNFFYVCLKYVQYMSYASELERFSQSNQDQYLQPLI